MQRWLPVTAATGALGPIIMKLTALLGDQYKLAPEGCRSDIEFIMPNLEFLHSLLLKIWEREDVGAACKHWMAEARRMSYAIEENVHEIMLGLERDESSSGLIQRETTTSPFEDLKGQVQRLVNGCSEEWKILGTISKLKEATGALGPVLAKLTSLLDNDNEYQLEKATHNDIESIKSSLEIVYSLLQNIWGREGLDEAWKEWMDEARDLSYIIEDDTDQIMLDLNRRDSIFKEIKSQCKRLEQQSIPKSISDIIAAKGSAEATEHVPVPPDIERLNSLSKDCNLQEGNKRDIEFIKSKLHTLYLWKFSEAERTQHLEPECKEWMAQAQNLLSSIGDSINKIIVDLKQQIPKMRPFEGLNSEVLRLVARRTIFQAATGAAKPSPVPQQMLGHLSDCRKPIEDPRSGFLHKDVSELVEMDEKKDQFIRLLQEHHTVCIFGFAGMGKTTLADLVHNAIGMQFECQAFVSVSPTPIMTRILTSIFTEAMVSVITKAVADIRKAVR